MKPVITELMWGRGSNYAGDDREQEANQVAAQVLRMLAPVLPERGAAGLCEALPAGAGHGWRANGVAI